MKMRTLGALGLTVIVVAGCGSDEGDAEFVRDAGDTVEETGAIVAAVDLPEYLTEEEVSAAWEDRVQRKVDGADDAGSIYTEVIEASCVVTDPVAGEARCTQEVKIGSYRVPSVKDTMTDIWTVTYDPITGVFRTVR